MQTFKALLYLATLYMLFCFCLALIKAAHLRGQRVVLAIPRLAFSALCAMASIVFSGCSSALDHWRRYRGRL